MRRFVLALAALAMLAVPAAHAAGRYGKQKVVYHINSAGGEADHYYMVALNNIQNQINAVGKQDITVAVVMHGEGVDLLKDAKTNEKLQGRVVDLKSQNVSFLVCNNTLKGRKIDPDKDLFDVYSQDIVPSGVAELSYLEQQGYTYIHP